MDCRGHQRSARSTPEPEIVVISDLDENIEKITRSQEWI